MRYSERFGEGVLVAVLVSAVAALGAFFVALAAWLPWLRAAALPATGSAPTREVMEAAHFSCTCFALSEEEDGGTPVRVKAELKVCALLCMTLPIDPTRALAISHSDMRMDMMQFT